MSALTETTNKKIVPVFQKLTAEFWTDEAGLNIPLNRVSTVEKLKEKHTAKILTEAVKISNMLTQLHKYLNDASKAIEEAIRKENKPLSKNGSYTWYNFDMSVKIEAIMKNTIGFDQALMVSAKEILDKFIASELNPKNEMVKALVNSAFSNSKGGIDTNFVFRILKMRLKINDDQYSRACDIIESAQQLKSSKRYFSISCKNEDNQYQTINLQFSNV